MGRTDTAFESAGAGGGVWRRGDDGDDFGIRALARQGAEVGGGSTEIQRNIISERVLGMPREPKPAASVGTKG